jgi:hypothetical protein
VAAVRTADVITTFGTVGLVNVVRELQPIMGARVACESGTAAIVIMAQPRKPSSLTFIEMSMIDLLVILRIDG